MLHADARLGRFTRSGATWRVFGQLKSGAISGNAAPPGPPDRDDLDLNQLFVDLALPVGPAADRPGAGRLPGPDSLTVRLGRQEMNYGSGRLISVREGPNVRFGFDAARLILRRGGTRVDLFAARPVGTSPGRFDDRTIPGRDLAGVYATLPSPGLGGSADAYYLYARRADIAFSGPGRGGERRHSVGGRLFGSARGWDWNAEAVGQWGEFDAAGAGGAGERRGHDIRAWTLATDTGYTWAGRRGRPRLALKVDYASGDSDPDDGTVGTFNPLYPRGNYFGELGVLGPLNLTDVHPTLDFEAARGVAVTLDWDLFWRASAGDGVYGFAGNLLRPSGGSRARWVGHSPSVAVSWQAERHTNVFASWGYFAPGRFLRETGTARPISYGTLYVTYKF